MNVNQESISKVFEELAKTHKAYAFSCTNGVAAIRLDDCGTQKAEISFS